MNSINRLQPVAEPHELLTPGAHELHHHEATLMKNPPVAAPEVAWGWLWENIEGLLKATLGKPAVPRIRMPGKQRSPRG